MERSGFFDAYKVGEQYDRVYLAESFAQYFANFISDGVFGGKSGELQVVAMPEPKMQVSVNKGKGWIKGYWYENSEDLFLPLDVADGVLSRIDSIVVRLDYEGRFINLAVIKGAPSLNPSPAPILRNADYYDLKLAEVFVKAGAVNITQVNITDTRLDNEVCGIVHSLIDQVDTSTLFEQYLSWYEQTTNQAIKDMDEFKKNFESDLMAWYESIKDILDENVAINLQNQIDELESKKADNSFVWSLSNKINNTRTYTLVHAKQNTKHTLSGLPISDGIYQCQFVAVEDFNEGDIFEGFSAKPVGEETVLPDKAFVKGDLVSLVVDANNKKLAFKIGGGGTSKLNIFAQPTRPPINEGIWLQTNDKFKNVQVANNVVQSGSWSPGNEYENMPKGVEAFGCVKVGNKIYCIGGRDKNYGNVVNDMQIYDIEKNSWSIGKPLPIAKHSMGCVVTSGSCIVCVGGFTSTYFSECSLSVDLYHTEKDVWLKSVDVPFKFVEEIGCISHGYDIHCIYGNDYSGEITNCNYVLDTLFDKWEEKAKMPTPRNNFSCVLVGDRIYCLGGRTTSQSHYAIPNNVDYYSLTENTWTTLPKVKELSEDGVGILYGDIIYVVSQDQSQRVVGYDTKNNSVVTNLKDANSLRFRCGAVLHNNLIYMIGGYVRDCRKKASDAIETYNIDLNKWSLNADLRESRHKHGVASFDGKLYCVGGFGKSGILQTLEVYDVQKNVCNLRNDMPTPKYAFGCVNDDSDLYCLGGYSSGYTSDVDIYNFKSDTWRKGVPLLEKAGYFASTFLNGKIYCFGLSSNENETHIFDLLKNSWSKGALMPTSRHMFCCAPVGHKVYCFGGVYDGVWRAQVESYDTNLGTWEVETEMPFQNFGLSCVPIGTKIYCIGGRKKGNGDSISNEVLVYDTVSKFWSNSGKLLSPICDTGAALIDNKIYVPGGMHDTGGTNVITNKTQIMTLIPTKFPDNTLILQNSVDGANKYYTQLINSKQLFGDRLLTGFENAWIYANEKLKEYPAYYGDGEKWNKFKN